MKPVNRWIILGMSLFFLLNTGVMAADAALGELITVTLEAIPDLRTVNFLPAQKSTQPKPQNSTLILPIVTVRPQLLIQSRTNNSQPESQDILDFEDLF